jgi:hypothetical protein
VRKSKGKRARERERERERERDRKRKRKRRSKGKGKRGKMGKGESSSDSSDSGRSDSSSDSSESSSHDEREYSNSRRKKAKTESKAKPVKPAKGKPTETVISSDDEVPTPEPIDDAETQAELSYSDDGDDMAARSSMAQDSNDDRDTVTQPSVTTHTTLPSVMLLLPDATFVTLHSTLQQLARPIPNPEQQLARTILTPDLMNLIAEYLTPPIYGTQLFKLYLDILNIDTISIIAEYTGEPLLPYPRASNYCAKQANIII